MEKVFHKVSGAEISAGVQELREALQDIYWCGLDSIISSAVFCFLRVLKLIQGQKTDLPRGS